MAGEKAEDVKLIGSYSSLFAIRVGIVLKMKGVEYELLEETVGKKSELLLKSNPVYKKIPVLLHGGRPICESLIIVEYVDEVWKCGPAILPADPYDRALARFWAAYVDDKLFPPLYATLKSQTEKERAPAIEQLSAALRLLEEAFEKCSKGKDFFGGDTIGYLDIALGSNLGWLEMVEKVAGIKFLDKAKIPHLVGWSDRFCANEIVKEVMPDLEKLRELMKVLQPKWKAAAAASN